MNMYAWLGIALAVIAVEGGVYYAGGVGPRAELAAMVVRVKAMTAEIKAQEDRSRAERDALITVKDAERENTVAAVSAAWADEYKRLRNFGAGGRSAAGSVRFIAQVCNDPAANQRLSDAVSEYRNGVSAAIAGAGGETAKLLEVCQLQTVDLIDLQDYVQRARTIFSKGTDHAR